MASSEIARLKNRKKNRKDINDIYENRKQSYVIHYSCESFYKEGLTTNQSVRITSIGVRNLDSAQTHSWSIYTSAELKEFVNSIEENLDILEKDMLDKYFSFMEKHDECKFIHWNMRDQTYGFQALEHRYEVLKGKPYIIQDNNKYDLARILVSLYGVHYAPHKSQSGRKGRLMSLVEMNKIADQDALEGAGEALAFEQKDFLKLHRSTLRKLDILANIFDRVHANKLKTNSSFADKYGFHPIVIVELIKSHPLFILIVFIGVVLVNLQRYYNFFN